MEQFREGHINILVATDLAARGIDVKEISMWSTTICLTFMKLTFTAAEELQSRSQGLITVLQAEVAEMTLKRTGD
jgi:ATP-dependent RNA helicase DeaD